MFRMPLIIDSEQQRHSLTLLILFPSKRFSREENFYDLITSIKICPCLYDSLIEYWKTFIYWLITTIVVDWSANGAINRVENLSNFDSISVHQVLNMIWTLSSRRGRIWPLENNIASCSVLKYLSKSNQVHELILDRFHIW